MAKLIHTKVIQTKAQPGRYSIIVLSIIQIQPNITNTLCYQLHLLLKCFVCHNQDGHGQKHVWQDNSAITKANIQHNSIICHLNHARNATIGSKHILKLPAIITTLVVYFTQAIASLTASNLSSENLARIEFGYGALVTIIMVVFITQIICHTARSKSTIC